MTRRRSRFGPAGAIVALCVGVLSACGAPTITPAGQVGMEIPYVDPLAPGASPVLAVGPAKAVTTVTTGQTKPAPAKAGTAKQSATASVAPSTPKKSAKPETTTRPPPTIQVKKGPAKTTSLTLPKLGVYGYSMSGNTSLGPPPSTMPLTVAEGSGDGAQLWTLDGRRADGSGITEELTLARGADGVYLHTYRLDASTGLAGLILEFNPAQPVLFEPDKLAAGQTWKFDLTSTDGCARASTTLEAIEVGAIRHIRLATALSTVGPSSCTAVTGQRVQDLEHPAAQVLPTRISSDLHGTMAGIPVKATTTASNPTGPKPATDATEARVPTATTQARWLPIRDCRSCG
ncbi:MAG TPA: hypothetical protein VGJ14_06370 [Sporichthyaceae bacterium]|jgi:hypothetical protein